MLVEVVYFVHTEYVAAVVVVRTGLVADAMKLSNESVAAVALDVRVLLRVNYLTCWPILNLALLFKMEHHIFVL